tara:strand:- start:530 stop:811 length:282 start_codon:yes stop_codon:yes gene_type:complete
MKEFVGYDSWKRPVYQEIEVDKTPEPAPTIHHNEPVKLYVEATPEEVEAWRQEDYWNRGDYDPMVMFVVIPAIIQLMAMAMMGAVMYFNNLAF